MEAGEAGGVGIYIHWGDSCVFHYRRQPLSGQVTKYPSKGRSDLGLGSEVNPYCKRPRRRRIAYKKDSATGARQRKGGFSTNGI